MVRDNPSPYCQDGIRSESLMLLWHHVTTTDDEYTPTIQLYQGSDLASCCWDTSRKTVERLSWQHLSTMKRKPNSTINIYNEFESIGFFITIIIYLIFIRIRQLSCDFGNYSMKFKNWRERKNRPVFQWQI